MIGDVKRLRVNLHQRLALIHVDRDDDRFAALVESDESLLADVKGRRSVRRAFHGVGQRERDLSDCFPGRRLCFSFASHRLRFSGEFLQQRPGIFEIFRIKPFSKPVIDFQERLPGFLYLVLFLP